MLYNNLLRKFVALISGVSLLGASLIPVSAIDVGGLSVPLPPTPEPITTVVETVTTTVAPVVETVTTTTAPVVETVTTTVAPVVPTVSSGVTTVVETVTSTASGVTAALSGVTSTVSSGVTAVTSTVTSTVSGVTSALSWVTSTLSGVTSTLSGVSLSGITSTLTGTSLTGVVSTLTGVVSTLTGTTLTGVISTLTGLLSTGSTTTPSDVVSLTFSPANITEWGASILTVTLGFVSSGTTRVRVTRAIDSTATADDMATAFVSSNNEFIYIAPGTSTGVLPVATNDDILLEGFEQLSVTVDRISENCSPASCPTPRTRIVTDSPTATLTIRDNETHDILITAPVASGQTFSTSGSSLVLQGLGAAGDTVRVFSGASEVASGVVNLLGTFSFSLTGYLAEGTYTLAAQGEYLSGLTTVLTNRESIRVIIDRHVDLVTNFIPGMTTTSPFVLTGMTEPLGSALVVVNGGQNTTYVMDDGSFLSTVILPNGVHSIEIFAEDALGNERALRGNLTIQGGSTTNTGTNNGGGGGGSSGGGGGGGGIGMIRQDKCPKGDLSPSYYDGTCGAIYAANILGKPSSICEPKVILDASEILLSDVRGHWSEQYAGALVRRGIINNAATFDTERQITRAEIMKILSGLSDGVTEIKVGGVIKCGGNLPKTVKSLPFKDVKTTDWAAPYLQYGIEKKMISPQTSFRPNDSVMRAEAAKMIVMARGIPLGNTTEPMFADVDARSSLAPYILAGARAGLFSGQQVGNKRYFYPNRPLSRAEASKILALAFGIPPEPPLPKNTVTSMAKKPQKKTSAKLTLSTVK